MSEEGGSEKVLSEFRSYIDIFRFSEYEKHFRLWQREKFLIKDCVGIRFCLLPLAIAGGCDRKRSVSKVNEVHFRFAETKDPFGNR